MWYYVCNNCGYRWNKTNFIIVQTLPYQLSYIATTESVLTAIIDM